MDSFFQIESGPQTGACNMALDELLLETVRQVPPETRPLLIVRTYEWVMPTLSLGVHQPERDLALLFARYGCENVSWVKRPTGGRAILHGEDIAFSFITNRPDLIHVPLKDSYCILTRFLKTALTQLGIAVADSCESSDKAYLRSPACFETQTPSDLVDSSGQKLAGSAQLRRQGGLLQHGSAFIKPLGLDSARFSQALFDAVSAHYGEATLAPYPRADEALESLEVLIQRYSKESGDILARLSTTKGSHLIPASF